MTGLSFLHLELTSRCNKACWMCGRRKMEMERPELCDWGDMGFDMLRAIAFQVPRGIVIQFHNNGEPLLYPNLGGALGVFDKNIRCFNTNGKLLLEKADEIIGNMETLAVSVVQEDPEQEEQYEIVRKFLEKKGLRAPYPVYRLLGDVHNPQRWEKLEGTVARRILHSPEGSFRYQKNTTVPEIGICFDLLTHLAVDRKGDISLCVRFDPKGELKIGNIRQTSIQEAWASAKRRKYLEYHIAGRRKDLPGCSRCEYWGIPRGE